jgi:hypothetical protein
MCGLGKEVANVYDGTTDARTLRQKDIRATNEILAKARQEGGVVLPETVDGRVTITYSRSSKRYEMVQEWEEREVARLILLRHELQGYLVELRRRRRAEEKEQRGTTP